MKKVELLAPVGQFENALAAIENGADALFVGGKLFSARHFASNFEEDELRKLSDYCKLRDVKMYVTVNTLIKNDELQLLYDYLKELQTLKIDGVIIQDFGVMHMIKKYFPLLPIHASTQMSAHSIQDAAFLNHLGFKRIVLARELQIEDIKKIKEAIPIEIETFIHGALCYAYSGQCLLSSYIGGRSGNRGRCAQTCRMKYTLYKENLPLIKEAYLMSTKDICTLEILPKLIDIGVDSLKIEGRMKSPEYVASVVRTYRKYLDLIDQDEKAYDILEDDLNDLKSIFNRGGFSTGYYDQKAHKNMITEKTPKNIGLRIGKVIHYNPKTKEGTFYTEKALVPGDGLEIWNSKVHVGAGIQKHYAAHTTFTIPVKSPVEKGKPVYLSKNHQLLKVLRKTYEKNTRKLGISVSIYGVVGEPISYTLRHNEYEVTVKKGVLESAKSAPITKEAAAKQLTKFGATSFECLDLKIIWPEQCYVPISMLNELRREAVMQLEKAILDKPELTTKAYVFPNHTHKTSTEPCYSALVHNLEQLQVCLEERQIEKIYWEWGYDTSLTLKALAMVEASKKAFYLALPMIMRENIWEEYNKELKQFEHTTIQGYLCRTYGQFYSLQNQNKEMDLDISFNLLNQESVEAWMTLGANTLTLSTELSKKELSHFNGPVQKVIYGHIPLMVTEQCLLGHHSHCQKHAKKQTHFTLEDRKLVKWPICTDCIACKMYILSDKPLGILPAKHLNQTSISNFMLRFTVENDIETKKVLDAIFREGSFPNQTTLGHLVQEIE